MAAASAACPAFQAPGHAARADLALQGLLGVLQKDWTGGSAERLVEAQALKQQPPRSLSVEESTTRPQFLLLKLRGAGATAALLCTPPLRRAFAATASLPQHLERLSISAEEAEGALSTLPLTVILADAASMLVLPPIAQCCLRFS